MAGNRAAEAYTDLNKLPLKGLGCRVEGCEGEVELELGVEQARIRACQLFLAALRHNENVTDSKPVGSARPSCSPPVSTRPRSPASSASPHRP
jgi:hypothetical protein